MDIASKNIESRLASYKDCHAGETILVCGCGQSLTQLQSKCNFVTIGVNDVGRLFTPNYLVVLNSRSQFKQNRFSFVEKSESDAIFTQLNLGLPDKNIVNFELGKRGGTQIDEQLRVPFTRNSPYVAICLAMFMGAKRIGVIGVDFTEHHFFAKTGVHALSKNLSKIDAEYAKLYLEAKSNGIEIINLSNESRLKSLPKKHFNEFDFEDGDNNELPLNIVSYSTTPVAGVPEILSQCINRYTPHNCTCVWQTNEYKNGVKFNSALEWSKNPLDARKILAQADVVIAHNGKVADQHRGLLKNKAVVTMAHNYLWNVDQQFIKRGLPGLVVGQYQAVLPEFKSWNIVANPLDYTSCDYIDRKKNSDITICYTPSGKHEQYPANHRLYWHGKGYKSTMAILERLAKRYKIELLVVQDRQLSHHEVLEMKKRSHIVIDECVTGSYHRNSLEGLASGCVVVNGIGLLPGVEEAFKKCVDNVNLDIPFIGCSLKNLEKTLTDLIESGPESLIEQGRQNRLWFENHWRFDNQWEKQWSPAIQQAIAQTSANTNTPTITTNIIPVYWTCRGGKRGNFGDMLSPILTRAMSGKQAVFKPKSKTLFAVGSLLKFAQPGDDIWGTGFIDADDKARKGINVRAVRGPLSRDMLLKQGIECPEIYGDPALLLPAIYDKKVAKKYRLGIIPHYVDLERARKLLSNNKNKHICIIDIRAGVEEVIKLTRQCDVIIASSLHGIILAESYGIPTKWVEMGNSVVGKGFKFRDYYASTGREAISIDWRNSIDLLQALESALCMPPPSINLQGLISSFPYLRNKKFDHFQLPEKDSPNYEDIKIDLYEKSKVYSYPTSHCLPRKLKRETNQYDENIAKNRNRISIYGAATENYVEFMIATMRSFMKHNPVKPFDYYILGSNFSARTQRLMNKHKVRYLNIDLKRYFSLDTSRPYPNECFWIFKGPELFNDMGYSYSLAIDGDLLCCSRLDLDWLNDVQHIAGIDRGCTTGDFLKNIKQLTLLKNRLGLKEENIKGPATNSGVLFFNNANLAKINFFSLVAEAYRKSERAGIVRAGDDSTLALVLALHNNIELTTIPDYWNVYRGLAEKTLSPTIRQNAKIIHFNKQKPWQKYSRYPNLQYASFVEAWRNFWPDSRNRRKLNSVVQFRKPTPIDLYWYRGGTQNMGDEIAPYIISKILGWSREQLPEKPVQQPEKSRREVLISVGSVMRLSAKNTLIWGSGIRNVDQEVKEAKRYLAVRGPITRRRLIQLGYDCPEVYGDPAILLPQYYRPNVKKKYKLGIIPHFMDYPFIAEKFSKNAEVQIIDVRTNDIEDVVRQILSCCHIVSSSLHGIILSVSYGVPVRWIKCSNNIKGDDSKFYDYFSSLTPSLLDDFDFKNVEILKKGRWDKFTPLSLITRYPTVDDLVKSTNKIDNSLDTSRLLDCFPFEQFGLPQPKYPGKSIVAY